MATDSISAWGENGYAIDLLITAFLLCALLGGILTASYRRKRDQGEFELMGSETPQKLSGAKQAQRSPAR